MIIIQFGVALFLKTKIGSDPFTIFTQGLASTLDKTGVKNFLIVKMISGSAHVTPGVANMFILMVLFLIILIVDRKKINIGTLICVVAVGPIMDFAVKTLSYFPIESYNYFVKILLVFAGNLIFAMGFAILSASKLGVAPNDIIPFIIKDKTKIEYRWVRMVLDGIYLILGYFLGGVIGVGTIICLLVTGPFIQFTLPYGKKIVRDILGVIKKKNLV